MTGATVDSGRDVEVLRAFQDAWNRHDVEAILGYFADDAVFLGARGGELDGERLEGKDEIRRGVEARFAHTPDLRFVDDVYLACGTGFVHSHWRMQGTTVDGEQVDVRGCDLYRLRDRMIVLKDSFMKVRV
jgi:ketosteroid isomerase-like protein